MRAVFSCCPVASWKRRLNNVSFDSAMRCTSSSSPRSRSGALFFAIASDLRLDPGAGHELRLDRQLLDGALHRGAGQFLGDAAELEHDAARLHDGDPVLRVALARAHARLGRLLGDGLVREDVDPDLAAALDVTGHGDTGSFDLASGDPSRLEGLDAVLAEGDHRATLGFAAHATAVVLAVGDLSRHQHGQSPPRKCGVSWCSRVRRSISSSSARSRSSSGSASPSNGFAGRSSPPSPPSVVPSGVVTGSPSSALRRRPPPALITRRTPGWPAVSPTAMAASRAILSSTALLYGRMSPL